MGFPVSKSAVRTTRRAALLAAAGFWVASPANAGPTPCTTDGTTWTCTMDQSAGINLVALPNKLDIHGLTTAIAPPSGTGGVAFFAPAGVPGEDSSALTVNADLGALGMTVTNAAGYFISSNGNDGINGGPGANGGNGGAGGAVTLSSKGDITLAASDIPILAQSVGGSGGKGGVGVPTTPPGLGGAGGTGGAAGPVSVTNIGTLTVSGAGAAGIVAVSLGGSGGAGGAGGTDGTLHAPAGANGMGGASGNVVVNQTGNIVMSGNGTSGIFVGSQPGAFASAGTLTVNSTGSIVSSGLGDVGIKAATFSAGVANAGITLASTIAGGIVMNGPTAVGVLVSAKGTDGLDGSDGTPFALAKPGQAGGDGGNVSLIHSGNVLTKGSDSFGLRVESAGGRGGDGGGGSAFALPASGATGGKGGDITLDIGGALTTQGVNSKAISVLSQGGGGGNPGTGGALPALNGSGGNGGIIVIANHGVLATLGDSSHGIQAQSKGGSAATGGLIGGVNGNGGNVTIVNSADITTQGTSAVGIFGQSVTNLGSGSSGTVTIVQTGAVKTSGARAHGLFAQSTSDSAGEVTVTLHGSIDTSGESAHGIEADSASGKAGGNVTVTVDGTVNASGLDAIGILARSAGAVSKGNVAILIGSGSSVSGGTGNASAVRVLESNQTVLTNRGTLTTQSGLAGNTVIGGEGNDSIENFGTYIGGASLGHGTNAFNNRAGGVLAIGTNLDLGGPANILVNQGTLTPGGANTVFTAALGGTLVQTAAGSYALDLDFTANTADRVNTTGGANVAGNVAVHPMNVAGFTPGAHSFTIISAAGGLTDAGLTVSPGSAVVSYGLTHNATDEILTAAVDLTPAGANLSDNQIAVADDIGAILAAGGTPAFDPVAERLFNIPTNSELSDFYADISSEPYIAPAVSTMFAADGLNNGMMSCRSQDGGSFRFSAEGECTWFQMAPRRVTRESKTPGLNSAENVVSVNLGHQIATSEHVRLGAGLGYQNSDVRVGNLTSVANRGMAGLVFKYVSDPILAGLAVSGGIAKNDSARLVLGSRATSRQSAAFTGARARFAAQLLGGDNFYIRPMVDFNGGIAWVDGFREKGAGPLDLVVKAKQYTYANVAPAVEVGGEIPVYGAAVMRPFVRVGMTQFLSGDKQDISAQFEGAPAGVSPFINRATLDRTLTTVDAGVDLLNAGRVAARVDYEMQFGPRTTAQGLTLKLSTIW